MDGEPEAGWNADFVMHDDIHGVLINEDIISKAPRIERC